MLGCFYEIIYVALEKCLQASFTFFLFFFSLSVLLFYCNLHKINSAESLRLIFFPVHFIFVIFVKFNISPDNISFVLYF